MTGKYKTKNLKNKSLVKKSDTEGKGDSESCSSKVLCQANSPLRPRECRYEREKRDMPAAKRKVGRPRKVNGGASNQIAEKRTTFAKHTASYLKLSKLRSQAKYRKHKTADQVQASKQSFVEKKQLRKDQETNKCIVGQKTKLSIKKVNTQKISLTNKSQPSTLQQSKNNIAKKYKKSPVKARKKSLRSAQADLKMSANSSVRTLRSQLTPIVDQKVTVFKNKKNVLQYLKKKQSVALSKINKLESAIPISNLTPVVELDTDDVISSAWLPLSERQPLSMEKRMLLRGCYPTHKCCQQRAVQMFDNCTQWEDPAYLYSMLSASSSSCPPSNSNTSAPIAFGQLILNQNLEASQASQAFTVIQQTPGQHQLVLQNVPREETFPGIVVHPHNHEALNQRKNHEPVLQQVQDVGSSEYRLFQGIKQEKKALVHPKKRGRKRKCQPKESLNQSQDRNQISFITPGTGVCDLNDNINRSTNDLNLNYLPFEQNNIACQGVQISSLFQCAKISDVKGNVGLEFEAEDELFGRDVSQSQYQGFHEDSVNFQMETKILDSTGKERKMLKMGLPILSEIKKSSMNFGSSKVISQTDTYSPAHNPGSRNLNLLQRPTNTHVKLNTNKRTTSNLVSLRPIHFTKPAQKNISCAFLTDTEQTLGCSSPTLKPEQATLISQTKTVTALSHEPYQMSETEQQIHASDTKQKFPVLCEALSNLNTSSQAILTMQNPLELASVTQSQKEKANMQSSAVTNVANSEDADVFIESEIQNKAPTIQNSLQSTFIVPLVQSGTVQTQHYNHIPPSKSIVTTSVSQSSTQELPTQVETNRLTNSHLSTVCTSNYTESNLNYPTSSPALDPILSVVVLDNDSDTDSVEVW